MAVTKRHIRDGLAAATCTLIGIHPAKAEVPSVDSALLFYTEFDRITAVEAVGSMRKEVAPSRFLNLKLVYDALTGASANGATPSHKLQTFTSPSGGGSYTIKPDETPLDSTFRDARFAGSGNLELPLNRLTTLTPGVSLSAETDYISLGVNATLSRDLNRRNTTLSAGVSLSSDTVKPMGGAHAAFSAMPPPRPSEGEGEDDEHEGGEGPGESKTVTDLLLGVTQVFDRATVGQLNYSYGRASGYLTDPYKLLSVVDPEPGPGQGEPLRYLYESRPDSRVKQSFSGKIKRHVAGGALEASYRYMWDDWGIRSHTADLNYHHKVGGHSFVEPQGRFYRQTAADFYRHSLIGGDPLPLHASADYRLGAFDAVTVALKFGKEFDGQKRGNLRIGYYLQMGDSSPPDAIGVQKELNLFPNVGALFTQISFFFN